MTHETYLCNNDDTVRVFLSEEQTKQILDDAVDKTMAIVDTGLRTGAKFTFRALLPKSINLISYLFGRFFSSSSTDATLVASQILDKVDPYIDRCVGASTQATGDSLKKTTGFSAKAIGASATAVEYTSYSTQSVYSWLRTWL